MSGGELLASQITEAIRSVVGAGPKALHEPTFSGKEWEYLKECLDSTFVSSVGKFVDQFEHDLARYTGANFAVATVNGTAALHIALKLAGVIQDDEVLIPALTPWREWLRTYRDQGRGIHYLTDPGSQDITTQVMLDQLPSGFTMSTQVDFLTQWGINDLVSEGNAYWETMKHAPDIAAIKMRSRSIETLILSNNDGLGTFCALTNDLHTNY